MKVSILIPVRNGEQFLKECLDSVLNQTFKDWELTIVNDNSSDSTEDILKEYQIQDSRIRYYTTKGKGIINALQLAYSYSSGELITRMDADDIMLPEKLELMVQKLQESGKGNVAVGFVEYFAENGVGEGYKKYQDWLNELTLSEKNFNEIYRECVIPSPSWMIYREDFEKIGGFNSDIYPEDYELTFRMYKYGLKVASITKVIHKWRDYSTRTSRTDPHYSDNFFLPLKMKYFIELHRDSNRPLEVWGAGNKGKELAKYLIEQNIEFEWACNNPNKIGKDIYGKILISDKEIFNRENPQILIAIRNDKATEQIKKVFDSKNLTPNLDYFLLS
ncbi:MAG: glycosyltransferase family 2 protein [Flavobacteriales bacterium]